MGYLNLVDSFLYGEPVFRAKLDALAENDAFLKDNGWNNSTKAIFYQAAAPTGWTKDTTNNDKMLRITTASGAGTGGTQSPSGAITLAHSAHAITAAPNHTHNMAAHTHQFARAASTGGGRATEILVVGGYLYTMPSATGSTAPVCSQTSGQASSVTSGSAGTHSHGGNSSGTGLSNITLAYCDVIACTKDSGGGTYTAMTSYFNSGDKIDFDPFVTLATNDAYLHTRIMPASAVLVFGQATAPAGWTKVATTNDKALRVVSGTGGGTGGSQAIGTAVSMAHTHSTPTDAGHTHTIPNHTHTMNSAFSRNYSSLFPETHYAQADGSGFLRSSSGNGPATSITCYQASTAFDGSGTSGTSTDAGHTHTLLSPGTSWQLAYVDVIQCSKDSAGAPYAYEDCTSGVFGWKKLVSKQKLNKLAKNDEHVLFHTPEPGTKSFFLMAAAPLKWTKLVTQDDKALRIVSGSSGGTAGGGSIGPGTPLPLAHTHTVSSYGHVHSMGTHTHALASATQTANAFANGGAIGGKRVVFDSTIFAGYIATDNVASTSQAVLNSLAASSDFGSLDTHDHGGVSGSALTDVTLAYVDVLYCSKD